MTIGNHGYRRWAAFRLGLLFSLLAVGRGLPPDGRADQPSDRVERRRVVNHPQAEPSPSRLNLTRKRPVSTSRDVLRLSISLLHKGLEQIRQHADYTGSLYKQERIDGTLHTGETIEFKIRHNPPSVELTWTQSGQEAVYVKGQNDGKLLIRLPGWRRILGTLKLNPNGPLAMHESRFPITETGLLATTKRLIAERKRDLALNRGVSCQQFESTTIRGCACFRFVFEYSDLTIGPGYRKLIMSIDQKTLLPLQLKYYGWPDRETAGKKSGEETLVGHYVYRDLDFDRGLGNADFTLGGDPKASRAKFHGVGK